MTSLVLISQNIREQQILTMGFEQLGTKILLADPTYQSYVLVLQFMPDIILIELPHVCIEQLSFSRRIRSYKRTRLIPIIGYGYPVEAQIQRGLYDSGVTAYLTRPLTFTALIQQVERLLKPFNKSLGKKEPVSEKEKDIAMILSDEMVPSHKIGAMTRHIAKLVAFPFTVTKVLQLSNDPKTGAADLGKAIAADPAISTHLLKVANSVFFASVSRRIGSIKEAIVRIGFSETKRIVMGMSVMNLFTQANKNLGFDRTDFWYHSLVTALMAERTAKCFGDISTEEAFIAGLLHDLGILFLDDFFPQVLAEVLGLTSRDAGFFHDVEMKRLGISHLDLITDLFPKWKIPQQITDAIAGQYAILTLDRPPDTVSEKLAACVAIGNLTAKMLHLGRECDEFVNTIPNLLLESAKMPAGITSGIAAFLQTQMTTFRSFLGLEPREYGCNYPDGFDPKKIRVGICNFDRSLLIPPMVDLQNEGIKCDMLRSDLPASEYQGKYHALILWSASAIGPELVEPYTRLCPAPVIDDNTPDTSKRVPVFLFCPDAKTPERNPGCTVINTAFDLRFFETSFFGAFE